jgi:hypothetical protein
VYFHDSLMNCFFAPPEEMLTAQGPVFITDVISRLDDTTEETWIGVYMMCEENGKCVQ